jgi:hypothetical protein
MRVGGSQWATGRRMRAHVTRPFWLRRESVRSQSRSMHWFLELIEELKIECRVSHLVKIRAAEPRKQKHDRRGRCCC